MTVKAQKRGASQKNPENIEELSAEISDQPEAGRASGDDQPEAGRASRDDRPQALVVAD